MLLHFYSGLLLLLLALFIIVSNIDILLISKIAKKVCFVFACFYFKQYSLHLHYRKALDSAVLLQPKPRVQQTKVALEYHNSDLEDVDSDIPGQHSTMAILTTPQRERKAIGHLGMLDDKLLGYTVLDTYRFFWLGSSIACFRVTLIHGKFLLGHKNAHKVQLVL